MTGMLFPAGMVTGSFNPTMANSELVEWSDEIVTAAFEAVSVACSFAFDPTVTLPKLRLAGEIFSFGFAAVLAPAPVPETFTVRVGFEVLLVSVRLPPVYPVAVGVKITGTSTVAQGPSVAGKAKSPNENALPCSDLERITTAVLLVFVSWTE